MTTDMSREYTLSAGEARKLSALLAAADGDVYLWTDDVGHLSIRCDGEDLTVVIPPIPPMQPALSAATLAGALNDAINRNRSQEEARATEETT